MARRLLILALAVSCAKPAPPAPPPAAEPPAEPLVSTPPPAPEPPPKPALRDYPGPAGLKWGMSVKEVKAILGAKYKFDGENHWDKHTGQLRYRATEFGGIVTSGLVAFFCDEGLASFAVFPGNLAEKRTLYRQWVDTVAVMQAKYGPPDKLLEPPSIAAVRKTPPPVRAQPDPTELTQFERDEETKAENMVAEDVEMGRGNLNAGWWFAENRIITVFVTAQPTEKGQHVMSLLWEFADRALLQRCQAAKTSDF